jgi:hypothetical protein
VIQFDLVVLQSIHTTTIVKSIQFTVSPILLPIVDGREFLLVVLAATGRRPKL